MPAHHHSKVLIIGAGPAGYTAAIYAARAHLKPILVQGLQPGGQLMITTDVENFPGFADVIQGPWLMEQMQKQAEHVGTEMFFDVITEVDFSKRPFEAKADSGDLYTGDTVIIATGAQARWLGLESERTYAGAGVSDSPPSSILCVFIQALRRSWDTVVHTLTSAGPRHAYC